MKKETIIKIILLVVYYIAFYFLYIRENLIYPKNIKYPVFDFEIYRIIWLLILLYLFPLSILFVSFKKRIILSIILSIAICLTNISVGFSFAIQTYYKSYTTNHSNYLMFDKAFREIKEFRKVFPKKANDDDIYHYYYNNGFFYAIPDSYVTLITKNQSIVEVENQCQNSNLTKSQNSSGSISYYSLTQDYYGGGDTGIYLNVMINHETELVKYLYITSERFDMTIDDFQNYIINNVLPMETINLTTIKDIFAEKT